ncbi:MAG: Acetate kinase [Massilia sp.]|jgi:acetate kinase|nr:Acetate kinase [Massilia sp.]
MSKSTSTMLAINAGSTSIKFALYRYPELELLSNGEVSGIGGAASTFMTQDALAHPVVRQFAIPEQVTAVQVMVDCLLAHAAFDSIVCVVHRIVHGGAALRSTCELTDAVLMALYQDRAADPEHMPQELRLVEAARRHLPLARQIACFDSSFHATMPAVASMLPVPRRYFDAGIMRLGYHGISCEFLMRQLRTLEGPAVADGKVILAHLGGGASVTAVEHGRSVDTTMGLTPSGGIVMSTRSGDIDPGFAWHCARTEHMSAAALNHMLSQESGLRGISGSTGDMAELVARETSDSCAAQAVALFCYQARKAIGAMAAALGGLDVLVFAGGIGEHGAAVRARICARLAHLGVRLDEQKNRGGEALISAPDSRVVVRIIATDEQWMLAENARVFLAADEGLVGGANPESN